MRSLFQDNQKRSNELPNIAAILKQEITRVARREVRSLTKSLFKASAQYRRDIAELKRRNSKAQAEISRLERLNGESFPSNGKKTDTENVRFTARGVKAQRKRLGVSAAEYANLIGVTAHTVYSWEHGASKPRRAQLSALSAIRALGRREVKQRLQQLNGTSNGRR